MSDTDSDGPTEDTRFEFSELIHPLNTNKFLGEIWGKQVHCGALPNDEVLERLMEGFHGCEFASIASDSRKDDNTKYSSDEVGEMQSCLDNNQTVNLPFCFTPGARGIRNAFMKDCNGYGVDVEVGVYCSVVGGRPAPWHLDNNHNLTIQLTGKKDWLLIPGEKHENLTSSREIHDVPTNMKERLVNIPGTSPSQYDCYTLEPGSLLYLPPGHWHSVVPVAAESLSVDLRVANVSQAKWIAEAIFALLSNKDSDELADVAKQFNSIGPDELGVRGPSSNTQHILDLLKTSYLDRIASECRLPLGFPSEAEYSDGLNLGASLEYLLTTAPYKEYRNSQFKHRPELLTGFRMNPLVSMICKRCSGNKFSFSMLSVSSLSKADYLNFTIYTTGMSNKGFEAIRKLSEAAGWVDSWADVLNVEREITTENRKRKRDDSFADENEALIGLLRILSWGNIIFER